jgi:hypothetical protein
VTKRAVFGCVVAVVCSGAAVLVAEIATRAIDGYRLTSARLELSAARPDVPVSTPPTQKWRGEADALPYVAKLAASPGVERSWFPASLPDRPLPTADAELAARAHRYRGAELAANYEWNWKGVLRAVCVDEHRDQAIFNQFDDVYVFEATDGSQVPMFRFLQNAVYPSGLRTNAFGWRGPNISVAKPPRSIRIAFIGASTTIGPHMEPYSYPEVVGFWLDRWAAAHHLGVSFEVINAGREGLNSRSFRGIVRQELQPVEPDFVVYYEGANQFWPTDYIAAPLPPRSRISGPTKDVVATYSALGRRVETALTKATEPGSEPRKPPLRVDWPPDVDENDPDVSNPQLPAQLRDVLTDLDAIRLDVEAVGGKLVMTSFPWLVFPGLVLDPVRDADVFAYLNSTFWPFSYAHMRRFLDLQTRVLRKYAATRNLDFIDVASQYPQEPRLFDDAVHMTRAGMHLQAWIVFNGLAPAIERRLAAGELPRPSRHPVSGHPGFTGRRLIPMKDVRAACKAATHE